MKLQIVFLLFLIFPIIVLAQVDSILSFNVEKNINQETSDTSKHNLLVRPYLPPRSLIIKMKDLKEIKGLKGKPFIIIDDTAKYTAEELASGLSEEELASYKKNKDATKEIMTPPKSEEETYPLITKIRKVLGTAQTIGAIIILIISLGL
jgi:hypothetical protein